MKLIFLTMLIWVFGLVVAQAAQPLPSVYTDVGTHLCSPRGGN